MNEPAKPTPIAARLDRVHAEIEAAVARRGPGPSVQLIGVSKRHPLVAIEAAAAAGLVDFGENYAQELRDKQNARPNAAWRWHFIGAMQSNKAKLTTDCALIHSVDRPSLLTAIERQAARDQKVQHVLVQVNIAAEAGKSGVAPPALADLLDRFADLDHLYCRGLMLIPPLGSATQSRRHFRALRQLAQHHARIQRPHVELTELSMGMSRDFSVAIEEGATMIRVGTAIFGPRAPLSA